MVREDREISMKAETMGHSSRLDSVRGGRVDIENLIHSLTSLGQLARLAVGDLRYQVGELHGIKNASFMSS